MVQWCLFGYLGECDLWDYCVFGEGVCVYEVVDWFVVVVEVHGVVG